MHNTLGKVTILLVEDDAALAELVCTYLKKQQLNVAIANSAAQSKRLLHDHTFSLIILDIGLPDNNNFQLCRYIKSICSTPIIILTARNSNADQIMGLELGADDYLIKPVNPMLLLARIHALLRRVHPQGAIEDELQLGQLLLRFTSKQAKLADTLLPLTTQEFNLLWVLASHAGQILNRDYLLKNLRGIDFDGIDRTIDIKISKLRHKLGDDPQQPGIIKTIWGQGYLFVKDAL